MGWYARFYGRPGPGVRKDEPPKTGIRLLLAILGREWRTLILLNLLFCAASLPVVTIPAALCTMQHVTIKMVQDEPVLLWPDFRAAFAAAFRRGTLWGWGYLILALASVFCVYFYGRMVAYSALFLLPFSVAAVLLVLLLLTGVYYFPLLIRSDMRGRSLIKNALLMATAYAPHAFAAVLAAGTLAVVCDLFFLLAWPFVLLILFSLQALLCSLAAWPDICRQSERETRPQAGI